MVQTGIRFARLYRMFQRKSTKVIQIYEANICKIDMYHIINLKNGLGHLSSTSHFLLSLLKYHHIRWNNKLGYLLHKRRRNSINLFVMHFASNLDIQVTSLQSDYYFTRVRERKAEGKDVHLSFSWHRS